MNALLPWHRDNWRHTAARLQSGRMPHALLLCGPQGLGKHRFAGRLTQSLLCEARRDDGTACGQCRSCHLLSAGTHPDYRLLAPLEEGKQILIDQVRDLGRYLGLKSQLGGYKVAMIDPADKMTASAANGLLKGLEEPPAGTVLMLLSARSAWLPATVRSRCQRLAFCPPARADAREWLMGQGLGNPDLALALAQGAPLNALALADNEQMAGRQALFEDFSALLEGRGDPLQIAAKWLKLNINLSLYWMYTWLVDMMRIKAVANPPDFINVDKKINLARLARNVDMCALYRRLDHLQEALRLLDGHVNRQLLLEDLLLPWSPQSRPCRAVAGAIEATPR